MTTDDPGSTGSRCSERVVCFAPLVVCAASLTAFLFHSCSNSGAALKWSFIVVVFLAIGYFTLWFGRQKVTRPPLDEKADMFTILGVLLGLVATDVAFIGHANTSKYECVMNAVVAANKLDASPSSTPNVSGPSKSKGSGPNFDLIKYQTEKSVRAKLASPAKADWVGLQVGHKIIYLLILLLLASLSVNKKVTEASASSATVPKTGDLFVAAWLAAFALYSCHVVTAAIDGMVIW